MAERPATRPEGVAGSAFPGPYPVGSYAARLRDELRKRARVQLFGEVWNFRASKAKVYFELRDGDGAVPCSMWRDAFERAGVNTLVAVPCGEDKPGVLRALAAATVTR